MYIILYVPYFYRKPLEKCSPGFRWNLPDITSMTTDQVQIITIYHKEISGRI